MDVKPKYRLLSSPSLSRTGSSDAIPLYTGYPRVLLNIATVTCIAYMVVGVPGNLLTIVALVKSKKVRIEWREWHGRH